MMANSGNSVESFSVHSTPDISGRRTSIKTTSGRFRGSPSNACSALQNEPTRQKCPISAISLENNCRSGSSSTTHNRGTAVLAELLASCSRVIRFSDDICSLPSARTRRRFFPHRLPPQTLLTAKESLNCYPFLETGLVPVQNFESTGTPLSALWTFIIRNDFTWEPDPVGSRVLWP